MIYLLVKYDKKYNNGKWKVGTVRLFNWVRNGAENELWLHNLNSFIYLYNNYSPKWRWLVLGIYRGREAAR